TSTDKSGLCLAEIRKVSSYGIEPSAMLSKISCQPFSEIEKGIVSILTPETENWGVPTFLICPLTDSCKEGSVASVFPAAIVLTTSRLGLSVYNIGSVRNAVSIYRLWKGSWVRKGMPKNLFCLRKFVS